LVARDEVTKQSRPRELTAPESAHRVLARGILRRPSHADPPGCVDELRVARPAGVEPTAQVADHEWVGKRNAARFQRAISQPFRRVNRTQMRRPRYVPWTWAVCGPPKICEHAVPAGTGAYQSAGSFASAPQSAEADGQWSVERFAAPPSPGEKTIV